MKAKKYVLKPAPVMAFPYDGTNAAEFAEEFKYVTFTMRTHPRGLLELLVLDVRCLVSPGDMIVFSNGAFSSMGADAFHGSYKPAYVVQSAELTLEEQLLLFDDDDEPRA